MKVEQPAGRPSWFPVVGVMLFLFTVRWLFFSGDCEFTSRSQWYGTKYSGGTLPLPSLLKQILPPGSVLYMAGAGEDITLDINISQVTGNVVHVFDPTPRSLEYLERVQQVLRLPVNDVEGRASAGKGTPYGTVQAEIQKSQVQSYMVQTHPVGIGEADVDEMKFFMPTNPGHISASAGGQMPDLSKDKFFVADIKSVESMMHMLGHAKLDMIKVNIEGLEIPVLRSVLEHQGLRPSVIMVTYDVDQKGDRAVVQESMDSIKGMGYVALGGGYTHKTFINKRHCL